MLQFPLYFTAWIATGTAGVIWGSIAVRRAQRRARQLVVGAQSVHTELAEPELVSAA